MIILYKQKNSKEPKTLIKKLIDCESELKKIKQRLNFLLF